MVIQTEKENEKKHPRKNVKRIQVDQFLPVWIHEIKFFAMPIRIVRILKYRVSHKIDINFSSNLFFISNEIVELVCLYRSIQVGLVQKHIPLILHICV